jgi:hypothetical protein
MERRKEAWWLSTWLDEDVGVAKKPGFGFWYNEKLLKG